MSDSVIKVQGLGKKYQIRHGGKRESYQTLRDALPKALHSLMHPFKSGQEISEDFWALKDVSFEIKRGECVGIIGRNGAGKSTLLKILSRITEPTTGRIELHGRVGSLLEVGTGFHNELTGRENIYLNGTILGMKKKEIDRKFDEIVAFSEIEKFLDTPVKRYSSGMYVRLAFAVAAHLEPEILIVDEVLAVGDMAFQKKCLGKMEDVAKEGRTVLFVSHNMGTIQSLCSCAFLFDAGKLIKKGEIKEIVSSYYDSIFKVSHDRDLSARRDRVGGRSLKVLNFDILDSQGRSFTDVPCGSSFCFVIRFQNFEAKIDNLRFGVALMDKNTGRSVTGWSSYYGSNSAFSCETGVYDFVFEFHKMCLAPGQYNLKIGIESGMEALDWIENAGQLIVSDGLYYQSKHMPDARYYPVFFSDFTCFLKKE